MSTVCQNPSPTDEQLKILSKLIELRAATPIRLEIETNQIGRNFKAELELLEEQGWLESEKESSGLEIKVFYPSKKTYGFFLRKNCQAN